MTQRAKAQDLQPGDVLSFECTQGRFGFAVIVSKIMGGHVVALYDHFCATQEIPDGLETRPTFSPPLILDTFSLIERAAEGNWRRVGSCAGYEPDAEVRGAKFSWGLPGDQHLVDIHNQSESVSDQEAAKWPWCSPSGDADVKSELKAHGVDVEEMDPDINLGNAEATGSPAPGPYAPFRLLEHDPRECGLLLIDNDMVSKEAVFAAHGREGNGYGWSETARVVAEDLPDHDASVLEFNPSAGMMSVYGPRSIVVPLAAALQELYVDEAALGGVVARSSVD